MMLQNIYEVQYRRNPTAAKQKINIVAFNDVQVIVKLDGYARKDSAEGMDIHLISIELILEGCLS